MADKDALTALTKILVTVKLTGRATWPEWYRQYRTAAQALRLWHIANPNKDPDLPITHKEYITLQEFKQRYRPIGDDEQVEKAYKKHLEPFILQEYGSTAGIALFSWIQASVDRTILSTALSAFEEGEDPTVRNIVIKLKKEVAPTETAELTTVRERYRGALQRARQGGINRAKWYEEWHAAWREAKAKSISEVDGVLAVKDFLQAIQVKLAPDWATRALSEVIREEAIGTPLD
jgi:hypothetical protein